MKHFVGGVIVGVLLTASMGLADGLYDRQGQPAAPRGSIQQQDYFRQRGQQLDIQNLRQQADRQSTDRKPCP